jgi:hypothetical protein
MIAALNYDHPQRGMIKAWADRFPHNVREYDFLERQRNGLMIEDINVEFFDFARSYRPDLIFMQLQESGIIQAATLRQIREALPKTVLTHWMGDCRTQVGDYIASISRITHLSLLSNVGQIREYEYASGVGRTHYLQIGLDYDEDVMGIPNWTPPFRVPDVVFCGGYYPESFPDGTSERVETVRAVLAAGIDVGVVSPGPWPGEIPYMGTCTVKQQHHVWKRAKVCLNVNHFNRIERYYSDRQLISMASGRPVVCWGVPGLEREFKDRFHCMFFNRPEQAVDRVRELLGNPQLANEIGQAGRDEVIRNHTWAHRVEEVLPEINRIHEAL